MNPSRLLRRPSIMATVGQLLANNPLDDGVASEYDFGRGRCSMVKSGKIDTCRVEL